MKLLVGGDENCRFLSVIKTMAAFLAFYVFSYIKWVTTKNTTPEKWQLDTL